MDKLLSQIKDNWMILSVIVALVLWYGNTNSRLSAVEARVTDQQVIISSVADIKTDVAVIKSNVEYIKSQISKN